MIFLIKTIIAHIFMPDYRYFIFTFNYYCKYTLNLINTDTIEAKSSSLNIRITSLSSTP